MLVVVLVVLVVCRVVPYEAFLAFAWEQVARVWEAVLVVLEAVV